MDRWWQPPGRRTLDRFDQAMVRCAAIAIGENWSNDTFKLAAVALRAAIRIWVAAKTRCTMAHQFDDGMNADLPIFG